MCRHPGLAVCAAIAVAVSATGVFVQAQSSSARTRPAPPATLQLPVDVAAKQVSVRAGFDKASVAPGAAVSVIAEIKPGPRMHVYAPGQPGYLVVNWQLEASPDVKASAPAYPASKTMFLEAVAESVKIYDATFRVTQRVSIADTPAVRRLLAAGEPLTLTGTLKYQACDDRVCYVPDTVRVKLSIPLANARSSYSK